MSGKRGRALLAPLFLLGCTIRAAPASGGEADVLDVEIQPDGDGTWRFDVTVRHADEGWEHFADRWEVLGPDGKVLAERPLAHPHVDEQPFTRWKVGIAIPPGVRRVTVRAHDGVHGYGGVERTAEVPEVGAEPTGSAAKEPARPVPSPAASR